VSCYQEFDGVLEMAVEGVWAEIAGKELGGAKRTSCGFEVTVRLL
jgi:hypothetical protein